MMPGDPVTGGTVLRRPAIQSPNYVPGVSGWAINADGSAEFQTVILPAATKGATVTFSSTAPASPNTGDLWYNTAAGLEVSQWNGSAWVPFQIGTGAIAAGTVTTGLIAANAVTAAKIAAATITGAQLAASVTARSIGGITTTIAASAPGGPSPGDIWINSAAGNQLNQWSGSAWTALAWNAADVISAATITGGLVAASTITGGNIAAGTITAANIAANSITAGQLAAGIIYAGIINGTTVQASQYIATSSGGEFLAYTGTPAAGNLETSIAGAAGTDSHANAFGEGVQVQSGSAYLQAHVNALFGAPAVESVTGAVSEQAHSAYYTVPTNPGAVNEVLTNWITGPASTWDSKSAAVVLQSSQKNGAGLGGGSARWAGQSQYAWGSQGPVFNTPAGQQWWPVGAITDITNRTASTLSLTQVASTVNIPAGDATQTGVVYRLRVEGNGTMGATASDLLINIAGGGGFTSTMASVLLNITGVGANNNFSWWAEAMLVTAVLGASGAIQETLKGAVTVDSGAISSANSLPFIRHATNQAWNSTVLSDFTIMAAWNTTAGTLRGFANTAYREGPVY